MQNIIHKESLNLQETRNQSEINYAPRQARTSAALADEPCPADISGAGMKAKRHGQEWSPFLSLRLILAWPPVSSFTEVQVTIKTLRHCKGPA